MVNARVYSADPTLLPLAKRTIKQTGSAFVHTMHHEEDFGATNSIIVLVSDGTQSFESVTQDY